MKHDLIKTDNYLLVISDLNRPAKAGETFLSKEGFIHTNIGYNYGDKLIIAHLPLNNSPILEGVDLLPPLPQGENNSKDYSLESAKEFAMKHFEGTKINHPKGGLMTIQNILDVLNVGVECGHKFGYNKAKETYKYTEDDMIDFAMTMISQYVVGNTNIWDKNMLKETLALKQPKQPIAFECETMDMPIGKMIPMEVAAYIQTKCKTITNSQGKTQWVGKYIY